MRRTSINLDRFPISPWRRSHQALLEWKVGLDDEYVLIVHHLLIGDVERWEDTPRAMTRIMRLTVSLNASLWVYTNKTVSEAEDTNSTFPR